MNNSFSKLKRMNITGTTKIWKRVIIGFTFLINLLPILHAQAPQKLDSTKAWSCRQFRDGTFRMPADSIMPETIITRKGAKQTEIADKKTPIESVVKWIDDCTYTLTPTPQTIALIHGLPKGCFLTVKIIDIKGDMLVQESKWNFYREVFTTKVYKIKDKQN